MICGDFLFKGYALSDFGLKLYDPEDTQEFIGLEVDRADISSARSIPNHFSVHYSNVLTLPLLAMKDVSQYVDQEDMRMTGEEINQICAWLQSPKTPQELFMTLDDEEDTYYFGLFTDIQPYVINQECYGLYLTFTCNAPYGFTDLVKSVCKVNSTVGSFNLIYENLSSELCEFVKPTITIYADSTFASGDIVYITNNTDDGNTMALTMPEGKSKLIIDCQKKYLCDEDGILIPMSEVGLAISTDSYYNVISADTYAMYWLRLLPGTNKLQFTTTTNSISKIEVCARFPKKAGGF